MPKKAPKSITAISQSHELHEYKYKSYEELSQEFQEVYPAAARAFVLIPQMYNRLTLVDGLTHKDALVKIHNDHNHLSGFTERNIRRYLPTNNPNIPRRVRTSRPKSSITETSNGIFFSDTKSDDDRNRQSINKFVVDDISSDNPSETAYGLDLEADNILNFEVSLPYRDIQRYIAALRKNGKNEIWFTITINADKGKMISFKTGRNSELEKNSFNDIGKSLLTRNNNQVIKSVVDN
jgi:hypothetical protein